MTTAWYDAPSHTAGAALTGTTDWYALFSAMTFYPQAPPQFVTTVAELADTTGVPLQIDVRPEGVVLDSGKDAWEDEAGEFVALAQQIEGAAKDLEDDRPNVTDIYDPHRLNPVLFFQQLNEPRLQRNRIHFELAGIPDLVADPEGNEAWVRT